MKCAIMQPYLFPYIGYWQLINAVDIFVIFDNVQWVNKGWINRNRILKHHSSWQYFTIPVESRRERKLIQQVNLSTNFSYEKKKLLKTLNQTYKKAQYFTEAYQEVENILNSDVKSILELNIISLKKISKRFNIQTKFILASSLINFENNEDATTKLLKILNQLDATHYINLPGGKHLYNISDFSEKNISLKFIQTHAERYNQFSNHFIPDLSIIDIMMFNHNNDIKRMLSQYYVC